MRRSENKPNLSKVETGNRSRGNKLRHYIMQRYVVYYTSTLIELHYHERFLWNLAFHFLQGRCKGYYPTTLSIGMNYGIFGHLYVIQGCL